MHSHLNVKNVADIAVYFLPIYQFAINQGQRIVVRGLLLLLGFNYFIYLKRELRSSSSVHCSYYVFNRFITRVRKHK